MQRSLLNRLNAGRYVGLALLLLVGFGIGLFAGSYAGQPPVPVAAPPPSMSQCTAETAALLRTGEHPGPDALRQAIEHCYALIQSAGLLRDFATRELNFLQQYRTHGILMWMVVGVTLSGVLLAGLQLMASYELARESKKAISANQQLSIEGRRIVLRSSVIGLFILLLSLGFFLVFVIYVYRFEYVQDQGVRIPYQTPMLPPGTLGPPPLAK